jgi:hypothetical protein
VFKAGRRVTRVTRVMRRRGRHEPVGSQPLGTQLLGHVSSHRVAFRLELDSGAAPGSPLARFGGWRSDGCHQSAVGQELSGPTEQLGAPRQSAVEAGQLLQFGMAPGDPRVETIQLVLVPADGILGLGEAGRRGGETRIDPVARRVPFVMRVVERGLCSLAVGTAGRHAGAQSFG